MSTETGIERHAADALQSIVLFERVAETRFATRVEDAPPPAGQPVFSSVHIRPSSSWLSTSLDRRVAKPGMPVRMTRPSP